MSEHLKQVNTALEKKFPNKNLTFGKGYVSARVVFVGECSISENGNGSKLMSIGSERVLNKLLRTAGIDKRKVYITNVIKYCKNPTKAFTMKELKSSVPFLREELKTIKPQVVVALGNIALNGIGLRQPLTNIRGKVINLGSYELIATYHPDSIAKNPDLEMEIIADFTKLKEILKTKINGS